MMFDRVLFLDAETRWSRKPQDWCPNGYTLSGMTVEEYIRSPLFCAFGFGYKWLSDGKIWQAGDPITHEDIAWVSHISLPTFFESVDWSRTAIVCHNAQFDAAILAWIYGKRPVHIFDTLSMARATRGLDVGNSAARLAEAYGLPEKGKEVYLTDGLYTISEDIERKLASYCKHDVWLCEQFFLRLMEGYPKKELRLIDATIRMFTEPQLELDERLLSDAIQEEATSRANLLASLGVTDEALASNDKFAEVLRSIGVEPPTKISKTTGEEAYAFAKNDAMFQALQNSDDERVVQLCEARMRVKSTQERTRAQRFLDIASRGKLPVPVNYAHTRTLRWGAAKGSNINMQNLKRGGTLRKAILAPEGHQCVAGDLSQIEPRVLAYLSDFDSLLEIFRSGKDAYAQFGAQMFGIPGLSKESHPDLRQSAKSALLGAGYGLGWASFATQLLTGFLGAPPVRYDKRFAKLLGITTAHFQDFASGFGGAERMARLGEIPHTCTTEELLIHCVCAKEIIDRYRSASEPVTKFWEFLTQMLEEVIANKDAQPVQYKCLTFAPGKIYLPNGLPICYDGIQIKQGKYNKRSYTYWNGKAHKNLYFGILAENVTSGTARCVIGDGMLRVQKHYPCAMPVHDEGVWVVPDAEVASAIVFIKEQLTKPCTYMPGLPLGAEVGANRSYGLAKK